ncbi:MAG: hypothetical protein HRU30_12920 [Rhodobacteraceae bacterium]|nr:hypothetical protein [Paracoccaceae bacterium]
MKHAVPERRKPYKMLEQALADGWESVHNIPLKGEGEFVVLTLSGLIKLARNRKVHRITRKADGYGPARTTVVSVRTGNYLGAIAWRWPDPEIDKALLL